MTELRPNQWLGMLVKLTAPLDAVKAAEGALGMEPALALLPGYKLTQESAIFVASRSKRMPNYGTICELLDEWWTDHKPSLTALPAPEVDTWQKKHEEHIARCRDDWSRPEVVRRAVREIEPSHPMRDQMGKLLGMAVAKFGYFNLHLVPPEWHPVSERNRSEAH